jgi:hypothetical protein
MPIVFMPQHREYWDYFSFRSPRVVAEREHWLACFKDFLQKITFAAATRSARQPQQAKTSDATAAADADAQRKEQRREQPQPPPPPQQQQQQQQRRQRRLLLKSPCHTARVELLLAGAKTGFLSHLYINVIFLPRQARDKHRENSKKKPVFSQSFLTPSLFIYTETRAYRTSRAAVPTTLVLLLLLH